MASGDVERPSGSSLPVRDASGPNSPSGPYVPPNRRPDFRRPQFPWVSRGHRGGRRGRRNVRTPLLDKPGRGSYQSWRSEQELALESVSSEPSIDSSEAGEEETVCVAVEAAPVVVPGDDLNPGNPDSDQDTPTPPGQSLDACDDADSEGEVEQIVEDILETAEAQVFGMACTEAKITRVKQVALQEVNKQDRADLPVLDILESACSRAMIPTEKESCLVETMSDAEFSLISRHAAATRRDVRFVRDYTESHAGKVARLVRMSERESRGYYAARQDNYWRVMDGQVVQGLSEVAISGALVKLARTNAGFAACAGAAIMRLPTLSIVPVIPEVPHWLSRVMDIQGGMEGFSGEGVDLVTEWTQPSVVDRLRMFMPKLPSLALSWDGPTLRRGVVACGVAGAIAGAIWCARGLIWRRALPGCRERKVLED